MKSTRSSLTPRRIADYCDLRLAPVLEPEEVGAEREYLASLLVRNEYPPYRGGGLDLKALVDQLGMDPTRLAQVRASLQPIFDAVARTVAEYRLRPQAKSRLKSSSAPERARTNRKVAKVPPASSSARKGKRPGRRPKPVVEFPDPRSVGLDPALRAMASPGTAPTELDPSKAAAWNTIRHGHAFDLVVGPSGVGKTFLVSCLVGSILSQNPIARRLGSPMIQNVFDPAQVASERISTVQALYSLPSGHVKNRSSSDRRAMP